MGGAIRMYSSRDKNLMKAIREDDSQLFAESLQKGANVNKSFDYGWTPLHWASFKGRTEMVETLVNRGARTNRKNNDKNTPLDICCYDAATVNKEQRLLIMKLLKDGANPSINISNGSSGSYGSGVGTPIDQQNLLDQTGEIKVEE